MSTDPRLLLEVLEDFARKLSATYEITDSLHDLVHHVVGVLGLAGAGISLVEDDELRFVTADDERVTSLERLEERDGSGPSFDASRSNDVVAIGDLRSARTRWAGYVDHALALGIESAAAIPLHAEGVCGALTLYDEAPRTWGERELRVGRVLADVATGYVVNASRLSQQQRVIEQLTQALESRIVIEQAKGIIAAHRDISVDEAFRVLRKHANDHNAGLHPTAHAVVRLGLRP